MAIPFGSRVTAVATASLLLLGIVSAPALAIPGGKSDPTPEQLAHASTHMLTWADVPESMKVAPGWEFTAKSDPILALELCTKNGIAILSPRAPLMYQVELGETDAQVDPTAFQENIWQYPDSVAAARAWSVLQQRARKCTGRSIEREPGGRPSTQFLTNGITDVLVNGQPGIWTHSRFSRPLPEDAPSEGGYYVVFLNGDVIQSVEYDFPDTKNLSERLRRQVQSIAQSLALRWTNSNSQVP